MSISQSQRAFKSTVQDLQDGQKTPKIVTSHDNLSPTFITIPIQLFDWNIKFHRKIIYFFPICVSVLQILLNSYFAVSYLGHEVYFIIKY